MEVKNKKNKINKDILNVIRTTMRNNIELTHIADNKASILLSLNALMITFLVPFIIPYIDFIRQYRLGIPLTVLIVTCFMTIYISARVLKPGQFNMNKNKLNEGKRVSPFFFGNYYKMSSSEFREYISAALEDKDALKQYISDDLHFIGSRLGRKMFQLRIAFNLFMIGFFSAISLTILFLFIF